MSGQVASQNSALPSFQGTMEAASSNVTSQNVLHDEIRCHKIVTLHTNICKHRNLPLEHTEHYKKSPPCTYIRPLQRSAKSCENIVVLHNTSNI